VNPSSEKEIRSRGRLALDRGRASRERGRPALERGGVPPSSETEPLSRGRPTHERGGFVPGGAVPLERSGVPPEGGWADCLTGRGSVGLFCARVLGSFAFIFYELKRVPPGCLGDPQCCPRQ
jgi:hypothetical protein